MRLVTTGRTEGEKEFKASVREVSPGEGINRDIDLSALFKPRFKIEFDVGGTIVPFYYNKIDPGTLMITHGSPFAVASIDRMRSKFKAAGLDPDNLSGDDVTEENSEQVRELLDDPELPDFTNRADDLRVRVLTKAVISPKLTKEIIEDLDSEIASVLYRAITGGISTDNESVRDFPDDANASEV